MPYKCAEKQKQYNRDYHRSYYHRDKTKALAYLQREEVKERNRARTAVYRAANPEKVKARNAVNNAIRDGRLQREPCVICSGKAQAHHDDYSKPLEVRWFCRTHHDLLHGKVVVDLTKEGQQVEEGE